MEKDSLHRKPESWVYWKETLNGARLVIAPMVEQSELAWRLLSRRYGAELCFTPMLHASVFARDPVYRRDNIQIVPEDRPLIVQFCGNDPEILLKACQALPVEGIDGVDLNLGCPQLIAKRGFYGAFLQDREHWPRIKSIVQNLHHNFRLPISCKIRVFPEIKDTLEYAKMLEAAGCQLLTVHGRTRDMKGPLTGVADWEQIKAVKEALSIPVLANGNIQYYQDFQRCLDETGADGVMTAEGNLHNPAITQSSIHPTWTLAREYLQICRLHPPPMSTVRGHLFKLFQHLFSKHPALRDDCARSESLDDLFKLVQEVQDKFQAENESWEAGGRPENPQIVPTDLRYPIWICQPYVRPGRGGAAEAASGEALEALEAKRRAKRALQALSEEVGLSKRRLRKLGRVANRGSDRLRPPQRSEILKVAARKRPVYVQCGCGNPMAAECSLGLCRRCCHDEAKRRPASCRHHKFYFDPANPRLIQPPPNMPLLP